MASPILISKPVHSISTWVVLKSIELTLTSFFKSLQNAELYTKPNVILFLQSLKVSIVLYIILNIPYYFIKSMLPGEWLALCPYSVNLFMLTLCNYLGPSSQGLFLSSLKYNNMEYYKSILLVSSARHHIQYDGSWHDKLQYLFKHSRQFKLFLRRYTGFYLLNCIIFITTFFPSRISTFVLGLISFLTFLDKLGPFESAVVVAILNFCDYYYTTLILTTYYGVNNLAQDLVIPYFNEIDFTYSEQQQWLKTRQGVLFGISLVYFWLLHQCPILSMTIYLFAIMTMGYIIPSITSCPPSHLGKLQSWCTGESVWVVGSLF
ncbi:uncharacterized protein SPAPADRAFT_151797 [Spathaspora passalidarum NRRL Y-27907]|uniref:Uncharacterized protein n=1 Tax=Spathaspora passalidarum (strain NRRL Y-27907 / 11-Y1) TaxID=619300 RepID=G3AK78_SPAPN|nr:uncharacterized protein SPAPADRAFT_151797 [Spathaspora passalidarum NRRL Y-27907]EGW33535.1 hypothetical protein SPAPADRAFT_151797 [Spathaspora passalidarum NRRL Y-27907]